VHEQAEMAGAVLVFAILKDGADDLATVDVFIIFGLITALGGGIHINLLNRLAPRASVVGNGTNLQEEHHDQPGSEQAAAVEKPAGWATQRHGRDQQQHDDGGKERAATGINEGRKDEGNKGREGERAKE
jgi:hypothetical protein